MNACFWRVSAVVVAVILVSPAAWAGDPLSGEWRVSTGFDYSTGDYGETEDTDIYYVPVTVRYLRDPWLVKLTVPWIRIKGPGGVVGGGPDGPVVTGGENRDRRAESGLGDVVASVSYTVPALMKPGTFVELTGKVKFGTADEDKELGTGENDYTLQVDVAKRFGDVTPFATLGYRFTGESDEFDLDDVFFVSVGGAYRLSAKTSAGLIYDYREAASRTSDDPQDLVAYLTHKLTGEWGLTAYAAAGLSDGSPDANVGFQVSYTFP